MNSVQVLGNLVRDPQLRTTTRGKSVAAFTVGCSHKYKVPDGSERELTDYINVVAWGALAEAAANQLRKGVRVFVEGRYSSRSYETQDGQKRYVTEVNANVIAIPLGTDVPKKGDFSQFGKPVEQVPKYDNATIFPEG